MDTIYFNNCKTSSLGFGCSFLTRHNLIKDAILNLETAYDMGIRHFDVAPLYGYGHAEEILGRFLVGKRRNVTITTKTGLSARAIPLFSLFFINSIRKLLNTGNSLPIINSINKSKVQGSFSPLSIRKDLEVSLRKLRTDYIDFYLLHESDILQANAPEIISVLENAKTNGKILNYGLASNYANICSLQNLNLNYTVIQHNSNIIGNEIKSLTINNSKDLRIIYNIFSKSNFEFAESQFKKSGFENSVDYILNKYKKENKGGITLFSSTKNKNIRNSIEIWNKPFFFNDK